MAYDIVEYKGRKYPIAIIPNVFYGNESIVMIGASSLNCALFDEDNGYPDEEAEYLDEQIYAFMEDKYFALNIEVFLPRPNDI